MRAGWQKGRKECRRAEMQVGRHREVCKDKCINIQTDKQKYCKDVQTYTDKQRDRRTMQSTGTG